MNPATSRDINVTLILNNYDWLKHSWQKWKTKCNRTLLIVTFNSTSNGLVKMYTHFLQSFYFWTFIPVNKTYKQNGSVLDNWVEIP